MIIKKMGLVGMLLGGLSGLAGCGNPAAETKLIRDTVYVKQVDTIFRTATPLILDTTNYHLYHSWPRPHQPPRRQPPQSLTLITSSPSTPLLRSREADAQTVKTVAFNTELVVLGDTTVGIMDSVGTPGNKRWQVVQWVFWYNVKHEQDSGYIRSERRFLDCYRLYTGNHSHGLLISEGYPTVIASYDKKRPHRMVDSLHLFRMAESQTYQVHHAGLAHTDFLFVYQTNRNSCPGMDAHHFLNMQPNGKLQRITDSFAEGESTYYSYRKVYLPVRLRNRDLILFPDANTEYVFNFYNGTLNFFPIPEKLDFPVGELIVEVREAAQAIEPLEETEETTEGFYKMQMQLQDTLLYRWDGQKTLLQNWWAAA